jgi:hypothetical protein
MMLCRSDRRFHVGYGVARQVLWHLASQNR